MKKVYAAIIVLVVLAGVCYPFRGRIKGILVYHGIIEYPYYTKKMKEFNAMPRETGRIVFLGDSITDFVNFDEVMPSYHIINRGIAGDTTSGVLRRLGEVISLKPAKLFLLIGTNDIGMDVMPAPIARNIREIVSRLQAKTPETKIYLQAVFPTRGNVNRPNTLIQELNSAIKTIAEELHCTFIDLYPLLLDSEGKLAEEYTIHGLHLSDKAVAKWMAHIVPYLDE